MMRLQPAGSVVASPRLSRARRIDPSAARWRPRRARINRLKRIDRAAVGVITLGGIAVVVERHRHPGVHRRRGDAAVSRRRRPTLARASRSPIGCRPPTRRWRRRARRRRVSAATSTPSSRPARSRSIASTRAPRAQRAGPASLAGATVVASSRSLLGDFVAVGDAATAASRCCRCASRPCIPRAPSRGRRRSTSPSAALVVARSTPQRPVRRVAYLEEDEQQVRRRPGRRRRTSRSGGPTTAATERRADRSRARRADGHRTSASAAPAPPSPATDRGEVYHWELGESRTLTDVSTGQRASPITALEYMHREQHAHRRHRRRHGQRLVPRAGRRRRRRSAMVRASRVRAAGRGRHRRSRRRRRDRSSRPPARRRTSCCAIRPPAGRWLRSARRGPRSSARRHHAAERRPARGARRRRDRSLHAGQSASRGQLAHAVRQGLVRGLRPAGVRLAVDRRDRRLRAEVQPGAAHLRHDQGHVLRAALRDSAGGARRALHLAVRAPDASAPGSSRRSRSWRRCRASSSASSPGCIWRRSSSAISSASCC